MSYRPMMGKSLLYKDGILIGGIYDDRLLIKITKNNKKYNMEESIPYLGAKHMYLVNEIDNSILLKEIIEVTYNDLK
jgi:TfoX/Sxy family transcriptional regulator of competence genes